jgi:hypothetical protein
MLLGHEILGATTQSQVFEKVSKPGAWKKAYVKPILRPLEVRLGHSRGCNAARSMHSKCARPPLAYWACKRVLLVDARCRFKVCIC